MKFRTLMSENVIMSTKYRICITHNAINLTFLCLLLAACFFLKESLTWKSMGPVAAWSREPRVERKHVLGA